MKVSDLKEDRWALTDDDWKIIKEHYEPDEHQYMADLLRKVKISNADDLPKPIDPGKMTDDEFERLLESIRHHELPEEQGVLLSGMARTRAKKLIQVLYGGG